MTKLSGAELLCIRLNALLGNVFFTLLLLFNFLLFFVCIIKGTNFMEDTMKMRNILSIEQAWKCITCGTICPVCGNNSNNLNNVSAIEKCNGSSTDTID